MDKLDTKLLGLMQEDAGLSVGNLAEQIGISKSACWRRIQKLEENGVIRQRVTLLEPTKIGLSLTVFISVRTSQHNPKWAENFKAAVQDISGITEVYRMGGDVDYLLKAIVSDMSGYDRLYQKLIAADLFEVTAGFVMETMKQTTVLPLSSIMSKD
ncbi:Lrp/AsnC family transcriptional regulator [Glaciecola sp. SC05]|uniref:Lrp/AsnC family transcriptional regulator n=1 Tax=Glaciecola sp. SC05 TaxID=1987355 RepID=UPI003527D9CE